MGVFRSISLWCIGVLFWNAPYAMLTVCLRVCIRSILNLLAGLFVPYSSTPYAVVLSARVIATFHRWCAESPQYVIYGECIFPGWPRTYIIYAVESGASRHHAFARETLPIGMNGLSLDDRVCPSQ